MFKKAMEPVAGAEMENLILGKAAIVRALYEGKDISPVWDKLMARVSADLGDASAFLDLAIILQAIGQQDKAAIAQKAALDISRNYSIKNRNSAGFRILAFVAPGDFMANTPIEFLLESSNFDLLLHFVDADTENLEDIPHHDVAFVAVGESAANAPILNNLKRLLNGWVGPILNNAPDRILGLTRDGVAKLLEDESCILSPTTISISRETLKTLASEESNISSVLPKSSYPIIVRPVGTHAGIGMERIAGAAELSQYLKKRAEIHYYIAPFIDYRGVDGRFRKHRIAFINGVAFPSHLAISDHWMVHYLSASMSIHEDRRAEEAAWMANFDRDFAVRHARAFDALHRHLGLDYFAIDCAELPDGRLLLFEADVAMIVHAMDSEITFPYKKLAMAKLFSAFEGALRKRVERRSSNALLKCAHTGKSVIYQRTDDDCLICVLAMFAGRTYEEVEEVARGCDASYPSGGPMSHSIMRGVANRWGLVLLSSIYMLWERPAIIGVVSATITNAGHAVLWDGEKIIDPGDCGRIDRAYIDRWGLEFTQRAMDLTPLIQHEAQITYRAPATSTLEPL